MKAAKENKFFKELSRRDYIQKADEIVSSEGLGALTIRRIAKEMNCTSACLYRYFENVEELRFFAQIGFLNYYLEEINKNEPHWRDVWDLHIGIWECYSRAAFTYPEAFNTVFFSDMSKQLTSALREYYQIFPEKIALASQHLRPMLNTPDFFERDYQMCQKCVEAGVITPENAKDMNRFVCMLYKGYLKGVIDSGVENGDIEALVSKFLKDCKKIISLLLKDSLGHADLEKRTYFDL